MNRRELTKLLGAGLLAAGVTPRVGFAESTSQVAITMDDLGLFDASDEVAEERNRAILGTFRKHKIKAALFVSGLRVDSAIGRRLATQWDEEGHIIANHTYSHRNYAKSDFTQYTHDILRCEALIKDFKHFRKLFRFPYLKEGDTAEQVARMRAFLAEQGYKAGAVTIDASDWYIDGRLRARLAKDPGADTTAYRDFYLQHILDRSKYYDGLSRNALGRSVRHTLLVHHNPLNEFYLDDVLEQYQRNGWKLIDAAQAYRDPVFDEQPTLLPAGDSLVLALAVQRGKAKLPRYPPEDGVYEAPEMDRLGL